MNPLKELGRSLKTPAPARASDCGKTLRKGGDRIILTGICRVPGCRPLLRYDGFSEMAKRGLNEAEKQK